ncbi:D-alanyl-D-alanine carboxypeptidase family protein [Arthrobacter halodurans]|uniref:D-alanyl-D-alanine carboxypeptidase family protein n=1 Tax=Arthrobacter halodurans TaxID=516699 RepID=A0ABV4UQ65_9MICC
MHHATTRGRPPLRRLGAACAAALLVPALLAGPVSAAPFVSPPAAPPAPTSVAGSLPAAATASKLRKTTTRLNLRRGATTGSPVLVTLPRGAIVTLTATRSGWHRATFRGKTGWFSSKYSTVVADRPGREIYIDGAYTSNRAGLADRYWTRLAGADVFESTGGRVRVGDLPRNSVVYRDLARERQAGGVRGWVFVRTQGIAGWMRNSTLQRKSTAPASSAAYTRAKVRSQSNGRLPAAALVAIPWDRERTLIAAPALRDLTRLNTAFRRAFGRNLDVDLAYRTLDTQRYLYRELGPYIAARPGTSNHGWGLAVDFPETRDYGFSGKYYTWLKANSKRYNWVHHRYLEQGSPYAEAWHFEYVGR